ncbi:MAG: DUF7314 family protein [archaeon]
MADEFAKGLAILTGSGLLWMVFTGWFNTPDFTTQFVGPDPTNPGTFVEMALVLKEGFFWFAILGALAFWVVIPAARELQAAMEE